MNTHPQKVRLEYTIWWLKYCLRSSAAKPWISWKLPATNSITPANHTHPGTIAARFSDVARLWVPISAPWW